MNHRSKMISVKRIAGITALMAAFMSPTTAFAAEQEKSAPSDAYTQGDSDGCRDSQAMLKRGSGIEAFTSRERLATDEEYAKGWVNGARRCQRDLITRIRLNDKHQDLKDLLPGAPENKRTPPKLPSRLEGNQLSN